MATVATTQRPRSGGKRAPAKRRSAPPPSSFDRALRGIANGGTTLRDYRTPDGQPGRNQLELGCYGRAGEPCLRCGTVLRRSVVDARGTTHCPTCQRRR